MSPVIEIADEETAKVETSHNRQLALEFVKRYPYMFTEDIIFWVDRLEELMNSAERT